MQPRIDIRIRTATADDAGRISYLIRKNTENVRENRYTASQKDAWIHYNTPGRLKERMSKQTTFCAFRGTRLAGTISLNGDEVTGLYVAYSMRGRGIGRKLMQYLERWARQKGISRLHLSATPSALQFYTSLGYIPEEKVRVRILGIAFHETAMFKILT